MEEHYDRCYLYSHLLFYLQTYSQKKHFINYIDFCCSKIIQNRKRHPQIPKIFFPNPFRNISKFSYIIPLKIIISLSHHNSHNDNNSVPYNLTPPPRPHPTNHHRQSRIAPIIKDGTQPTYIHPFTYTFVGGSGKVTCKFQLTVDTPFKSILLFAKLVD